MYFSVPAAFPPAAVTLLAPGVPGGGTTPINTATPTFSWTAVSDATRYVLWVGDGGTLALIFNGTFFADEVGVRNWRRHLLGNARRAADGGSHLLLAGPGRQQRRQRPL